MYGYLGIDALLALDQLVSIRLVSCLSVQSGSNGGKACRVRNCKKLVCTVQAIYFVSLVVRIWQLIGLATAELTDVVGTLRDAIFEETDFTKEAQRTVQFRQFLERSPQLAGSVTVPKVYPQASSRRVLTLERLYGVSLADLEVVRQYVPEPELALIVALNTWVLSVLTNEWFHADVHAGNLLVLRDGRVLT